MSLPSPLAVRGCFAPGGLPSLLKRFYFPAQMDVHYGRMRTIKDVSVWRVAITTLIIAAYSVVIGLFLGVIPVVSVLILVSAFALLIIGAPHPTPELDTLINTYNDLHRTDDTPVAQLPRPILYAAKAQAPAPPPGKGKGKGAGPVARPPMPANVAALAGSGTARWEVHVDVAGDMTTAFVEPQLPPDTIKLKTHDTPLEQGETVLTRRPVQVGPRTYFRESLAQRAYAYVTKKFCGTPQRNGANLSLALRHLYDFIDDVGGTTNSVRLHDRMHLERVVIPLVFIMSPSAVHIAQLFNDEAIREFQGRHAAPAAP